MDLLTPNVEMDLLGSNLEPEANLLDINYQDVELPQDQFNFDNKYEQKQPNSSLIHLA